MHLLALVLLLDLELVLSSFGFLIRFHIDLNLLALPYIYGELDELVILVHEALDRVHVCVLADRIVLEMQRDHRT